MRLPAFRSAGVVVHPSSLPSQQGTGCFGEDAFRFVDFLAEAGFSLWQILPLGPVDQTGSPYNSSSAFAGDAQLVCRQRMLSLGLKPPVQLSPDPYRYHMPLLSAFDSFRSVPGHAFQTQIDEFGAQQAHWLDDYALFCAIKISQEGRAWGDWPAPLRDRLPEAIAEFRDQNQMMVDYFIFEQTVFFAQWLHLKNYANQRGIRIIGDVPIFVAWDSADVWAHRHLFLLDEQGNAQWVAGVPPDYFSPEGQRWGNPLYDWERLADTRFDWWIKRIRHGLTMFDVLRIDHFRGFCACWKIPGDAPNAKAGQWSEVPGQALFDALQQHLGTLPIIAEDLGVITEDVVALREHFHLPGMSILQFAFDGSPTNPYLPHNLARNTVVYSGTHDNDTSLGWYLHLSEEEQARVNDYLGHSVEPMPWPINRCALASVANTTVLPLQDILGLDSSHRMNTPGTETGNWRWRCQWSQFEPGLPQQLRALLDRYGRLAR